MLLTERERGAIRTAEDRNPRGFTPDSARGLTVLVRREEVKPGMVVHSSHGYRLLVTQVIDAAVQRIPERHVEIKGHLHGDPACEIRNERYPAHSLIDVEVVA
jgi:hypothetical protein